ncbi:uncharacterized protein METZ01_LOCUS258642 [marine metagenome]|uniref:Uncharacterized protein n=1 Tax=marine metagenome TaxID=408172 RepID=A0A382J1V3_9ZZZZ
MPPKPKIFWTKWLNQRVAALDWPDLDSQTAKCTHTYNSRLAQELLKWAYTQLGQKRCMKPFTVPIS